MDGSAIAVEDSNLINLPIHCPTCGRAITLSYLPPEDRFAPAQSYEWHCPYPDCSGQGQFQLHGRFVGATPGLPPITRPPRE